MIQQKRKILIGREMGKHFKILKSKKIINRNGNIYRLLRKDSTDYFGFGEAYVSKIKYKKRKGWKKHKKMKLNISVPSGKVKFIIFDEAKNKFHEIVIGEKNYKRLIIFPNTWFAFEGIGENENIVINVSNILHDAKEQTTKPINYIKYKW